MGWRDTRSIVRNDRAARIAVLVTLAMLALVLWHVWLGGVWQSIAGSRFWMLATGTERGASVVLGLIGGFATLTIGHLFNAWLTRRRDDRLREGRKRAVAAALMAEIDSVAEDLDVFDRTFMAGLEERPGEAIPAANREHVRNVINFDIFRAHTETLGIFDPVLARSIVRFYRRAADMVEIWTRHPGMDLSDDEFRTMAANVQGPAESLTRNLGKIAGVVPDWGRIRAHRLGRLDLGAIGSTKKAGETG